jgi:hypothetical protein
MATSAVEIDPNTGERVEQHAAVQIDPATGERIEAPKPGMLDPRHGWSPGDLLRGAATGVKNMVMHPIDTAVGMAQPFLATGMNPNGMYPSTAPTGRPEDSEANHAIQMQAQQQQAEAGKFMKENPAYTIGNVVGPAIVTAGAAKMVPKIAPVLSGAADGMAEHLYGNAMKPSTTLSAAQRTAQIRTGLDNAIPVSPAGVEKLGSLIDDFNSRIADKIKADPKRPISPVPALENLRTVRGRFQDQVTPGTDVQAINNTGNEFASQFGPDGRFPEGAIPAETAQKMKQGTYSILRNKYGEQGSATVEAQKALARGLKEEIAQQFPEINSLNQAESKLLDLGPTLERAVNRISNNHTIGIGGPILGTAVRAATNSTGTAAAVGIMKSIIDIPAVKSRLAIALSRGGKLPYPKALDRVSAYSASLQSAAAGAQEYSNGDTPNQSAQ